MGRERWTCPGCQGVFSVADASEMILCSRCSKVHRGMSDGVRKRSSSWGASDIAFVVISLAALIGGGLFLTQYLSKMGYKPDPDKAAVDQWLRENTADGYWEEVKWYPPQTLQGLYDFNLLHIVEGIEKVKATYEKGIGKEEHKVDCQNIYDKFYAKGQRTFCAIKYRVATLNGAGKNLQKQVFEMIDGKPAPLISNEIREIPFALTDGTFRHNAFQYDGWKMFDDKEFDPFPASLLKNLDQRLQQAMVWKEPSAVPPPARFAPARPQMTPQPEPQVAIVPAAKSKPAEEEKETIPLKIREYFNRVLEFKSGELSTLEKRLTAFKSKRKTARNLTEIKALDDRITQTEESIAELKNSKLSTQIVSLPHKPDVGDLGWLQVMEVTKVVDQDTIVVRWLPNGKGKLPKVEVVIHPVETTEIKVGNTTTGVDFVKVAATKDVPSDVSTHLTDDGVKFDFVVEPVDRTEIEKWQVQFEVDKKK